MSRQTLVTTKHSLLLCTLSPLFYLISKLQLTPLLDNGVKITSKHHSFFCFLFFYITFFNSLPKKKFINLHYYSFKIFLRFWLVKTTRIIHHKQLLLSKNSVILNQWLQKCSPLQIIEPLTSKWRQKCSSLQIIEPLTEKTWAQGCVIQQRENWPRVEFTSLSEENILNE